MSFWFGFFLFIVCLFVLLYFVLFCVLFRVCFCLMFVCVLLLCICLWFFVLVFCCMMWWWMFCCLLFVFFVFFVSVFLGWWCDDVLLWCEVCCSCYLVCWGIDWLVDCGVWWFECVIVWCVNCELWKFVMKVWMWCGLRCVNGVWCVFRMSEGWMKVRMNVLM